VRAVGIPNQKEKKMRKLLLLFGAVVMFCACVTLTGTYSYIPIGPQNLSVRVEDSKSMPIFISRTDIKKPWASIGLMRIKNLPNDRKVITRELDKIKSESAKKGADALIVNQYFEDAYETQYPVTIAAYLVRYLDDVSDEDKAKIEEFATQAAIENATI
jgi:hypothetical protein